MHRPKPINQTKERLIAQAMAILAFGQAMGMVSEHLPQWVPAATARLLRISRFLSSDNGPYMGFDPLLS